MAINLNKILLEELKKLERFESVDKDPDTPSREESESVEERRYYAGGWKIKSSRDSLTHKVMCVAVVCGALFYLILSVVWLLQLILPEQYQWLSSTNFTKIECFLFGSIATAFIGKFTGSMFYNK